MNFAYWYNRQYRSLALSIVLIPLYIALCGFTDSQIADAIYKAEGGAGTKHPYGIMAHYKKTTPRQACLNTIKHMRRDWDGKKDFIEFLGARYAPLNAKNDPSGLNRHWIKNVRRLLCSKGQ